MFLYGWGGGIKQVLETIWSTASFSHRIANSKSIPRQLVSLSLMWTEDGQCLIEENCKAQNMTFSSSWLWSRLHKAKEKFMKGSSKPAGPWGSRFHIYTKVIFTSSITPVSNLSHPACHLLVETVNPFELNMGNIKAFGACHKIQSLTPIISLYGNRLNHFVSNRRSYKHASKECWHMLTTQFLVTAPPFNSIKADLIVL